MEEQVEMEKVEMEEHELGGLGDLPGVCLAAILSCLLPRDVARLARVCRSFRAAATFDSVWDRFLPPTYRDFLALDPDAAPSRFASKREIFDYLCRPLMLANHTMAFWLDRDTGGVCMSMAARGLDITWSDDFRYWKWGPDEKSLFPEVAILKNVCWFEARGEMECALPPGEYTFTWRVNLAELHGWHTEPVHFTLSKNDVENFECKGYIDPRPDVARQPVEQFQVPTIWSIDPGWTEYDVGKFFVLKGEETCRFKFSMNAIHRGAWKSGLVLDGVVIRPTETIRQMQPLSSLRGAGDHSGFHTPEFQPEAARSDFQFPGVLRRFFTNLPGVSRSWTR